MPSPVSGTFPSLFRVTVVVCTPLSVLETSVACTFSLETVLWTVILNVQSWF